jgi:hypothetical protein
MAPYVLEYNSDGVLNLGRGVIYLFCSEKGSQTQQHSTAQHSTAQQQSCNTTSNQVPIMSLLHF